MDKRNQQQSQHIFKHTSRETEQLQLQARALLPATHAFLKRAGITTGMRVLDVGSGAGDVALLAADLVGYTGKVVGIERNSAILEIARARAAGVAHVSFLEADLTNLKVGDQFDALIGRYILQHLRDPAATLRHLVRHLRPRGTVVFLEADLTHLGTSAPASPLFEQVGEWVREAFRCGGIDTQTGLRLYHIFLEAGLPAPQIECASFVGGSPDWPWYELIAGRVRSLLPILLQHGIATEEEIGIDTLASRLRDSLVSQHAVGMAPDLVAAWTQL